jgi:hypothetical protein
MACRRSSDQGLCNGHRAVARALVAREAALIRTFSAPTAELTQGRARRCPETRTVPEGPSPVLGLATRRRIAPQLGMRDYDRAGARQQSSPKVKEYCAGRRICGDADGYADEARVV